jgi:hypothetical protein
MSNFYVVGGQQRHARALFEGEPGWYKYQKGVILEVDSVAESATRRMEYVSPPEVCADEEPAILFKCSTLHQERLYTCTQTEVLIYSVPDFRLLFRVSLPCFNDVHHVRPTSDGTLLVANSGLDMVLEVTMEGQVLHEWNTLGEDPWSRFSREIDYRRVASTKPHHSHPNQVFYIEDEIWVTRFQQRDAVCLNDLSKRIEIGIELVHDGVVHGGYVYFTTVNGRIIIANTQTRVIEEVIDLNDMSPADTILGWCRGILIQDEKAWVGFTRLRLTKIRENVSWVRWGFKQQPPTRIACYDLVQRSCLKEIDVQGYGLDAVFSVFPAERDLNRVHSSNAVGSVSEQSKTVLANRPKSD